MSPTHLARHRDEWGNVLPQLAEKGTPLTQTAIGECEHGRSTIARWWDAAVQCNTVRQPSANCSPSNTLQAAFVSLFYRIKWWWWWWLLTSKETSFIAPTSYFRYAEWQFEIWISIYRLPDKAKQVLQPQPLSLYSSPTASIQRMAQSHPAVTLLQACSAFLKSTVFFPMRTPIDKRPGQCVTQAPHGSVCKISPQCITWFIVWTH